MSGYDLAGRPTTPTARGDRDQRKRDVLAAANAVLDDLGWEDFSIREVAARAGVSPGAVYQWFSGKGEIWARLQTARFERDTAAVEGWSNDLPPEEVVERTLGLIAENHSDIGRHRFDFVRTLRGEIPAYALELDAAHTALRAAIAGRVAAIMPDHTDLAEQRARLSWLWAVGKGVGDHLVDQRHDTHGTDREHFLRTSTRCVLAGLTA